MRIHRQSSTTLCPLPFIHTYVTANGSLVACCESQETLMAESQESLQQMWNSQSYRQLRQELLSGKKPQLCQKCWSNEEMGVLSNREEMWRDFEAGLFGSQELNVNDDGVVDDFPRALEIKTNNLCNLKCRMCHPESSHRIGEDQEIIVKYRKNLPWSKKVLSSQNTVKALLGAGDRFLKNLSVVQYSGGEPLISDEQLELTQTLLKKNPEEIHLRYATNLTHLSYKQVEYPQIWKHFKKVHIKVSIDGIEDVYNYIRVGSSFQKVIENLHCLLDQRSSNVHVSIGFTTQAYNVFQLPEFLNYFEKIVPRSAITTHLLHSPKMMMVDVFPEKYKEKLIKKLKERKDTQPIIGVLENSLFKEKDWQSLQDYTEEMEKKYNIRFGFNYLMEKYLSEII